MQESLAKLKEVIGNFNDLDENEIRLKYNLSKDGRDWQVSLAKKEIAKHGVDDLEKYIKKVDYRPFDTRYTYYTGDSKGFIAYPRGEVFSHLTQDNLGIVFNRSVKGIDFNHIFITDKLPDLHLFETANASLYCAPLYLYHGDGTKTVNFNDKIFNRIRSSVSNDVTPEDILDYIYAILHSPKYREKYKEFLKIDFPRVPYPESKEIFWKLVEKGKELRELHLMESSKIQEFITTFPEAGSNIVEKLRYEKEKVFINEKQYFGNVPEVAWNSYIGGYQPAQKWLKDRKGRELSTEDIEHYQKIIVILKETDKITKEIDGINFV